MNRYTKILPVCLAAALAAAAPYAAVRADDTATSVTTPGERHDTVEQTTTAQRRQQLNETAETWRNSTPDERHESYSQSAQQARNQGDAKTDAARQRQETWSQMSTEEHREAVGSTGGGNMENRPEQMRNMNQQRSQYGERGWRNRQ